MKFQLSFLPRCSPASERRTKSCTRERRIRSNLRSRIALYRLTASRLILHRCVTASSEIRSRSLRANRTSTQLRATSRARAGEIRSTEANRAQAAFAVAAVTVFIFRRDEVDGITTADPVKRTIEEPSVIFRWIFASANDVRQRITVDDHDGALDGVLGQILRFHRDLEQN